MRVWLYTQIVPYKSAVVAQLVEHVLGKDEVIGSIPVNGSSFVENAIPACPSVARRAQESQRLKIYPSEALA